MFCGNCGKKIPDVAKFCPECGSKISVPAEAPAPAPAPVQETVAAPVQQSVNAPVQETVAAPAAPAVPVEKKKFKMPDFKALFGGLKTMDKKKLIGIGAAAILAVVLIIFNFTAIANAAMKVVMSDEDYYQYVEMKEMKKIVGIIGDKYGEYMELAGADSVGTKGEIVVNVGDEARGYLNSYTGEDFSWLERISFSVNGAGDKASTGESSVTFSLGNNAVVSANAYVDMAAGTMYIQIPEMSETYAMMSLGEMMGDVGMGYGDYSTAMRMMVDFIEKCPDQATLEKILTRYISAVLEGVTDVDQDDGRLAAGGISGKYTVYEVKISPNTVRKVVLNVLAEFKKDKEVKELIIDMVPVVYPSMDGRMAYDELMSEVDWYIEDLREDSYDYYDDDDAIIMEVFVNAKGEVVGRRIVSYGEVLLIAAPEDGSEVGFELSYSDGYDKIALIGSGEKKGGMLDGKYEFTYNGKKLLNVKVSEYDTKAADKGDLYGKVSFDISGTDHGVLSDEFGLDYAALSMISNYSVVFESKPTDEYGFDVYAGIVNANGGELVNIAMNAYSYKDPVRNRPAGLDSAVPAEEWAYNIDGDAFMKHLYEVLPTEVVDMMMGGGFGASDDYYYGDAAADDYYYDAPATEAWPEEEW